MTPRSPRFVLITGLSGAGKTHALRFFEDRGYFCVDNLPAALIPTFAELVMESEAPQRRVAVCVDARAGEDVLQLPDFLEQVRRLGFQPQMLFMETSDEVLHRRYSETRRRHPSSPSGNIEEGIQAERSLLDPIRELTDVVVDSTGLSEHDLRERLAGVFGITDDVPRMGIEIVSFGYKHGLPKEADLVLDVRFLPNPHYDPELRPLVGTDPEVREFVLNNDTAREFLRRSQELLKYLLPLYEEEPKSYLTVAVGCTGGRHRSVAIAYEIAVLLRDLEYDVRLRHRDSGEAV